MSRVHQLLMISFLVLVPAALSHADVNGTTVSGAKWTGGRGSDEAACRQVEYYARLSDLKERYDDCVRRYSEYVANAQRNGIESFGSISSCGNPGVFSEQADTYSRELCAKICRAGPTDPAVEEAAFKRMFLNNNGGSEPNFDENEEAGSGGATCGTPGKPACTTAADPTTPKRETDTAKRDDTTAKSQPTTRDSDKTTKTGEPPKRDKPEEEGGNPSPSPREESVARTTPQDVGPAQAEAQGDIQRANSALNNGQRCCNSPQSCTNKLSPNQQQDFRDKWNQANASAPASGQGLAEYCSQMRSTAGAGGGLNNYMSTICYSGKNECEMTCDSLLSKYEALYNNCGGCSAAGIYSSTYNSIKSIRMGCNGLAQKASLLAQQGGANAYSGGYAQACNNFTGTPSSMGGLTPDQQKAQDAAANQNCLLNPSGPGCKTPELAVKEGKDSNGDAGFGTDTKDEKPEFNLQNMGDIPGLNAGLPKGVQGQAVTNGTIANNSGGGIPGGGGGSSASLGPKSSGSPGSPGYDTDVLSPNLGGGGGGYNPSASGQVLGSDPRLDGRWRTMSTGQENSPLVGMDLKQYLPGGSLDPNRKIAGISPGSQINRKEENIWRIISNKMYEKCKLGVLWQCGPE